MTASSVRYPPQNASQVMLFPGSRQWAAEDGCYVVGSFHSVENRAVAAGFVEPVVSQPQTDDRETPTTNNTNFIIPAGTVYPTDTSTATFPAIKLDPIHQSGALFAGLSPTTTLTLNVIYYYESFPGLAEPDILVLASPSAEYDPVALNIYSHCIGRMPVGVKVGENGLGDWFYGIAKKVYDIFSPAIKAIPHPAAQAAGILGDSFLTAPSPAGSNKKPKKKKAPAGAVNTGRGPSKAVVNKPSLNLSPKVDVKVLKTYSNKQLKELGLNNAQIKQLRK
jgi:hypothetical protein